MSLKYEAASVPQHISVKWLISNWIEQAMRASMAKQLQLIVRERDDRVRRETEVCACVSVLQQRVVRQSLSCPNPPAVGLSTWSCWSCNLIRASIHHAYDFP